MALEKTIQIDGKDYTFLFNYKALLKGDEFLEKETKAKGVKDALELEALHYTACQLLGGLQNQSIKVDEMCELLLEMEQNDYEELLDFFSQTLSKKNQISGYRFKKFKESLEENSAIVEGLNGQK